MVVESEKTCGCCKICGRKDKAPLKARVRIWRR